jgi:hypothetical protein
VASGDARSESRGLERANAPNEADNRLVEVQVPALDEAQRGSGGHELRHREPGADHARRRLDVRPEIGEPDGGRIAKSLGRHDGDGDSRHPVPGCGAEPGRELGECHRNPITSRFTMLVAFVAATAAAHLRRPLGDVAAR